MNHQQIAHRWAQMNSRLNVKGYAMFADGFSIFSWGRYFEIARWVATTPAKDVDAPAMCVLFNADGHSVSTAKHKTYTRRAIRGSAVVFEIPACFWPIHGNTSNATDKQKRDANKHAALEGLKWYEAQAIDYFEKATRARTYAESHNAHAESILNEAQQFASAFGVKFVRPDFAELKARANRQAIATAKVQAKARKLRAEQEKAHLAELALSVAAWLEGDTTQRRLSYYVDATGSALIRRSPDGEYLETSQGASVPWSHAVKAFRFVKLCRERGEAWSRNGKTVRVGHFQVDHIDAQGNMTAGCHSFKWANMEQLAIKHGVFDLQSSSEALEIKQ